MYAPLLTPNFKFYLLFPALRGGSTSFGGHQYNPYLRNTFCTHTAVPHSVHPYSSRPQRYAPATRQPHACSVFAGFGFLALWLNAKIKAVEYHTDRGCGAGISIIR
ncbi:hypothetical protein BDW02DRAFT_568270 [Decorospora gaudefroyi]|uniref:Uncharacterized protein n=1 Tax=Decorospora gaudefroyi TaxID=184978 RepID=A0A6A5KDB2_9PLEO|nr:hypothetical protein BDW02DRAFT_568270 [Decorospora gaudefroyi]